MHTSSGRRDQSHMSSVWILVAMLMIIIIICCNSQSGRIQWNFVAIFHVILEWWRIKRVIIMSKGWRRILQRLIFMSNERRVILQKGYYTTSPRRISSTVSLFGIYVFFNLFFSTALAQWLNITISQIPGYQLLEYWNQSFFFHQLPCRLYIWFYFRCVVKSHTSWLFF